MLVQNLGSSDIPTHKILSDPTQLRSLAQLHESLDWFAKVEVDNNFFLVLGRLFFFFCLYQFGAFPVFF